MKGSDFTFDCVYFLCHKYHKINFKRGGSYTESPDWIKANKKKINLINKKDDIGFKYVLTVALNYEKKTGKEWQKLNMLYINIIGKE